MACDIYILHVIMTSEAEGLFPFSCNSLIQLSYTCVYIYIYLLKGISCIRNRSTLSVNYDPSVLSPALVSPVLLWFLALTERGGRKKKYIALSDRFLESKGSTFASGGPTPPLFLWLICEILLSGGALMAVPVCMKGAHCGVETTLLRNNPFPKEAGKVLKKREDTAPLHCVHW